MNKLLQVDRWCTCSPPVPECTINHEVTDKSNFFAGHELFLQGGGVRERGLGSSRTRGRPAALQMLCTFSGVVFPQVLTWLLDGADDCDDLPGLGPEPPVRESLRSFRLRFSASSCFVFFFTECSS